MYSVALIVLLDFSTQNFFCFASLCNRCHFGCFSFDGRKMPCDDRTNNYKNAEKASKTTKKKNTTCAYSHMVSCTRMEIRQLSLFTLFFSLLFTQLAVATQWHLQKKPRAFLMFFSVLPQIYFGAVFSLISWFGNYSNYWNFFSVLKRKLEFIYSSYNASALIDMNLLFVEGDHVNY